MQCKRGENRTARIPFKVLLLKEKPINAILSSLSTPFSTPSPGNSNESTSTSPVFPVVVSTNVEQQSVMMGRLLETVNLMQQRMDKMEKQLHKLLSNRKVHVP